MNRWINRISVVCLLAFSACQGDDDLVGTVSLFNLDFTIPEVESYGRYYTIAVKNLPTNETGFSLHTDAEWMTLTTDTIPDDGIIEFLTENNSEVAGRTGNIVLTSKAHPELQEGIEIYQKGLGDYDSNEECDPTVDNALGWGFSAFETFQDISSIKGKVIDIEKLASFDAEDRFQSVQEVNRARGDFYMESAYSIQEMSSILTKKMCRKTKFLGVKKTVERFKKVCTKSVNEQYVAYARISKLIATRSFDEGALHYVIENYPDKLPFSVGFLAIYNSIKETQGNDVKLIKEMLEKYGTHVVIEASLGGMIDYVATFDKYEATTMKEETEKQCTYVFGRSSSSEKHTSSASLTSRISGDGSIDIAGGDSQKIKALKEAIGKMKDGDAIPNGLLSSWYQSVNFSTSKKDLAIIDFKFIPIWELFTDDELSGKVLSQVYLLAEQSNNTYSDKDTRIDYYKINLKSSDFDFSKANSQDKSLVRILYNDTVPILEICNEYVPKLRSDRRVTVFYPIYGGKANISQGLFPGDGDGNPPAHLSFWDGEVYVDPIEGYGYTDVLDTAYYVHGCLYETSYNITYQNLKKAVVKDETLTFANRSLGYPIVKIGSGYWTRNYITETMGFGKTTASGFYKKEYIIDNILFAHIYGTNRSSFLSANHDIYGNSSDPDYGISTLWYIPKISDRDNLTNYLGHNLKSLFYGQVSGFDAQFEGYYGSYDADGKWLGGNLMRVDKGNRCYVPFKIVNGTKTICEALVLNTNYTWTTATETNKKWVLEYCPVKLFRTSYFRHKNYEKD